MSQRAPGPTQSLLGDLLTQELILLQQALEALLHPGVIEANRPQPVRLPAGPGAMRLTDLYAVELELSCDAVLTPHPITYELPTPTNDLPMGALLVRVGTQTRLSISLAKRWANLRLSRRSVLTRSPY